MPSRVSTIALRSLGIYQFEGRDIFHIIRGTFIICICRKGFLFRSRNYCFTDKVPPEKASVTFIQHHFEQKAGVYIFIPSSTGCKISYSPSMSCNMKTIEDNPTHRHPHAILTSHPHLSPSPSASSPLSILNIRIPTPPLSPTRMMTATPMPPTPRPAIRMPSRLHPTLPKCRLLMPQQHAQRVPDEPSQAAEEDQHFSDDAGDGGGGERCAGAVLGVDGLNGKSAGEVGVGGTRGGAVEGSIGVEWGHDDGMGVVLGSLCRLFE